MQSESTSFEHELTTQKSHLSARELDALLRKRVRIFQRKPSFPRMHRVIELMRPQVSRAAKVYATMGGVPFEEAWGVIEDLFYVTLYDFDLETRSPGRLLVRLSFALLDDLHRFQELHARSSAR